MGRKSGSGVGMPQPVEVFVVVRALNDAEVAVYGLGSRSMAMGSATWCLAWEGSVVGMGCVAKCTNLCRIDHMKSDSSSKWSLMRWRNASGAS